MFWRQALGCQIQIFSRFDLHNWRRFKIIELQWILKMFLVSQGVTAETFMEKDKSLVKRPGGAMKGMLTDTSSSGFTLLPPGQDCWSNCENNGQGQPTGGNHKQGEITCNLGKGNLLFSWNYQNCCLAKAVAKTTGRHKFRYLAQTMAHSFKMLKLFQ